MFRILECKPHLPNGHFTLTNSQAHILKCRPKKPLNLSLSGPHRENKDARVEHLVGSRLLRQGPG